MVRSPPHPVPLPLGGGEGEGLVILRWFAVADRVSETFGDPETAAMVHGEGNRLLHVRFAGKQRGFETGRQRHGQAVQPRAEVADD